jgi:hypothetical protein
MLVISSPWFDPAHPLDKILTRSANVYDLALPNGLHPLWGSAIEKLVRTWHPYIGAWNIAPGYVALALSIVALIMARREAWRWAVIGLIAVVLSLGPIVQIGAMRTSIPLPYQVILAIPGLELARRPSHFIVITTLDAGAACGAWSPGVAEATAAAAGICAHWGVCGADRS